VSVIAVVAVALAAGFFMAWTIGANSNSPPFAPAVGANAIPVMRAALLVGIFGFLGAVLQGASISDTVGNDLINNVRITPLAAASGLLTAATFITVGNKRGYPIPAAFTVTGAMIGAGLALGGSFATETYASIATFWIAIPFVGGFIGFATATLLRLDALPETFGVPALGFVTGATVANMRFSFIPDPERAQGSAARYVAEAVGFDAPSLAGYDAVALLFTVFLGLVVAGAVYRSVSRSVETGIRTFLVILGALVVFSSGGSQVGLATGPLESLFSDDLNLSTVYLLGFGAVALLLGAWTGAPRVVQAVSREYSELGVRRSISALVPSFLITQAAITLGLPISANEVVISSLIGSGLVEGSSGISPKKIGYTVAVWIVSLFAALVFSYGLYNVLSAVLGVA
jgi:PiT family inorganic phosphate transporter